MKVRSPLIFEMSGKLGNAVASTARGGITYFRALTTPRNPLTFLQNAVRQALAGAANYWRTVMTETQQESWWDLAESSQTGQTLFTRVNQPRVYALNSERIDHANDDATFPNPPYIVEPPESFSTSITPPSLVIDDSANTLSYTPANLTDDWLVGGSAPHDVDNPAVLYVYASHQQSSSRFSRQHPYQLLAAAVVNTTPLDLPSFSGAHVINLAPLGFTTEVGKVMYVKMVAQRPDGALSVPFEQRVTIQA